MPTSTTNYSLTLPNVNDPVDQDLWGTELNANFTKIDTYMGNPTGTVIQFAASTVPTGYLECNGSAISRTTYVNLFTLLGTTFGAGDGATTFNIPDLRGSFIRGWDHGKGRDPNTPTLGQYVADQFASHAHTITDPGHTHTSNAAYLQNGTGTGPGNPQAITPATIYPATTGITINATGGTETAPKYIALMFCIKT